MKWWFVDHKSLTVNCEGWSSGSLTFDLMTTGLYDLNDVEMHNEASLSQYCKQKPTRTQLTILNQTPFYMTVCMISIANQWINT